MKLTRLIFIALTVLYAEIHAQKLSPGPQVLTFFSDADDTEQPYGLYLPKNYDENKKYPLVVMLHGAGSNHRLSLRRVFGKSNANGETDVEATRYFPEWKDVDYIVASPYARGTMGYQGVAEKDVYDVLADVKKRFSIDEDRIYLTGLSMGGGGSLWIGLTRPDIWAAIAPVCPAPPRGTDNYAPNALNIPMHFFHGDDDQAVPVTVSRDWVKRLKDSGTAVEYVEYPGVGHNSWENAYKDEFIFEWFSKFKRNKFPDRVRFSTTRYQYNSAYWVSIDKLTTGTAASIDAKFIAPNQLDITTAGLDAFTLSLDGHPKFNASQPLQVTLNGKKIKTTNKGLSFVTQAGKWSQSAVTESLLAKRKGLEGPLADVFATRHLYVYGTAGNPSQEELKMRIDAATKAANWSQYRNAFLGRVMFFPRVVSDKDVRPSDLESCNLVLFGTAESNSIIQQYAAQLPLQIQGNPSDIGLFFVYPVNNHYVAVSSGLPWWTGSPEQPYPLPQPFNAIPGFKDFVLFKGNNQNIVAEGYFTPEWKLTADDVKKLEAAGVKVK
jgi:poly(3-hydroxybutyrate) depolymerase